MTIKNYKKGLKKNKANFVPLTPVSFLERTANIFPTILNTPLRYACWSSDKEIFKILKNGLLDFHGIDSDNDTSLYIE